MIITTKHDIGTVVAFIPFDGDAAKYRTISGPIVGASVFVDTQQKVYIKYAVRVTLKGKAENWDVNEDSITTTCSCSSNPDYCEIHAA